MVGRTLPDGQEHADRSQSACGCLLSIRKIWAICARALHTDQVVERSARDHKPFELVTFRVWRQMLVGKSPARCLAETVEIADARSQQEVHSVRDRRGVERRRLEFA